MGSDLHFFKDHLATVLKKIDTRGRIQETGRLLE